MGKLIIYELNVQVDFLFGFVLTGHAKRMDHVQEGKKVYLTKKLNVFICNFRNYYWQFIIKQGYISYTCTKNILPNLCCTK